MPRLVNAYTINPDDWQQGDVALFVIKVLMTRSGRYRIYRCPLRGADVPQGHRVVNEEEVCRAFFPTLADVAKPD